MLRFKAYRLVSWVNQTAADDEDGKCSVGEILAKSWQSVSVRYGTRWGSVPSQLLMFAKGVLFGTQKDSAMLFQGCYVCTTNFDTDHSVPKLKGKSFDSRASSTSWIKLPELSPCANVQIPCYCSTLDTH